MCLGNVVWLVCLGNVGYSLQRQTRCTTDKLAPDKLDTVTRGFRATRLSTAAQTPTAAQTSAAAQTSVSAAAAALTTSASGPIVREERSGKLQG